MARKKHEDRLEARPQKTTQYVWNCPTCIAENYIEYGECDQDRVCFHCKSQVYVHQVEESELRSDGYE